LVIKNASSLDIAQSLDQEMAIGFYRQFLDLDFALQVSQ
jgi:hypothetical protein